MFSNKEELHVRTEIVAEDTNTVVHTLSYLFTKNIGGGNTNNDFELQITDPENPLLLFDYKLSPFDFPRLKEELVLYCEFSSFPNCIHDILTDCNDKDEFKAVIDCRAQDPLLLLQQMTKISLLTPIRLTLVPASDNRIKEYLANETKSFKAAYERTKEQLQELNEELEQTRAAADHSSNQYIQQMEDQKQKYKHQIEQMRQEQDSFVETLKSTHAASIEAQRQAFNEEKNRILSENRKVEESLRDQLSTLQNEKHQAVTQAERQTERISSLENQLKDAKQRIESLEIENKKLFEEKQELTTNNATLKTDLATLRATFEGIQKSLHEKTEYAQNGESVITELRNTIKEKDATIADLNQQVKEVKKKADERDWIADKSKKVIAKHQEDIRKLIEHINEKKTLIESKDNDLRNLEKENIRYQETEKQLQQQIEAQNQKLEEAREQNNELQKQIDELNKKIEEDQTLTEYLQKQLNAKKIEEMGDDEYVEDENLLNENSLSLANAYSPFGHNSPKGSPLRQTGAASYVPEFNYPQTTTLFDAPNFY